MKTIINFCKCLVWLLIVITLTFAPWHSIKEKIEHGEGLVGKEVVIRQDTLVILSYNIWTCDFYLSNGCRINQKIIDKFVIEKGEDK